MSENDYTDIRDEGSPFFRNVAKPFAEVIASVIPPSVHPDTITTVSILACTFGTLCILLDWLLLGAALWVVYATLDNVDGSFARRTGQCSKAGEFYDHTCDSYVASFGNMCYIWAVLRMPMSHPLRGLIAAVMAHAPFFSGHWAHHVLGHLILGGSLEGGSLFTVDELHFLVVPGTAIVRWAWPQAFDVVVLGIRGLDITLGGILIGIAFIGCLLMAVNVFVSLRNCGRGLGLMAATGIGFFIIEAVYRVPMYMACPLFVILTCGVIYARMSSSKSGTLMIIISFIGVLLSAFHPVLNYTAPLLYVSSLTCILLCRQKLRLQ